MTEIDDKITELTALNESINEKISQFKAEFYDNKKKIKKLEDTKKLLEE